MKCYGNYVKSLMLSIAVVFVDERQKHMLYRVYTYIKYNQNGGPHGFSWKKKKFSHLLPVMSEKPHLCCFFVLLEQSVCGSVPSLSGAQFQNYTRDYLTECPLNALKNVRSQAPVA